MPDHERLSQEVLGKWFKHRSWASFVRQLNTYGFRKIRNLHQGALHQVPEECSWEYAHSCFRRGQPNLLSLIERKKQRTAQTTTTQMVTMEDDEVDTTTEGFDLVLSRDASYANRDRVSSGETLPLAQIIQAISTLKREQSALSAEIESIKQSIKVLYQENAGIRKGLNNHQDILMKILKFIAEVFGSCGHNTTPHQGSRHDDTSHDDDAKAVIVVPHPGRLMIQDGTAQKRQDEELSRSFEDESINTLSPSNFSSIFRRVAKYILFYDSFQYLPRLTLALTFNALTFNLKALFLLLQIPVALPTHRSRVQLQSKVSIPHWHVCDPSTMFTSTKLSISTTPPPPAV